MPNMHFDFRAPSRWGCDKATTVRGWVRGECRENQRVGADVLASVRALAFILGDRERDSGPRFLSRGGMSSVLP